MFCVSKISVYYLLFVKTLKITLESGATLQDYFRYAYDVALIPIYPLNTNLHRISGKSRKNAIEEIDLQQDWR